MLIKTLFVLFLSCSATASWADNCDELRGQIDAKIKAAGVASYSLVVVDTAASAPGKMVGSCARGSKKIMYALSASPVGASPLPAGSAPSAAVKAATAAAVGPATAAPLANKAKPPAKTNTDNILTECKDGSTSVGGSCKK